MNQGRLNELIEQATPEERHQFLAGAQRVIIATDNSLCQRKALGERMIEAGISEKEIKDVFTRSMPIT